MKSRVPWLVVLIIGFAFFVRVYNVTSVPPSLSWDEVSIGYNAYSMLKTGRDEHGRFLPLDTFVAYGDYKPPLAIYLTVPFIAVFGLTELAVRLPSVIAGTIAVLLTYLLVIELFQRSEIRNPKHEIRNKFQAPNSKSQTVLNFEHLNFDIVSNFGFRISSLQAIALLSAFLLALSPWHIQLSRAGWEANIALTILLLGILLVLRAREQPRLLVVCWVPFILAMYTFNSARYAAPLLGLVFFFWIREKMFAHKRYAIAGVMVAILMVVPLVPHLISKEARLRFAEVNIFSDLTIIEIANERMMFDGNGLLAKILHNRRVGFTVAYLKHFFDHFQPWFLFIRGDGNPKFSLQEVGQLYLIEAPFLVYGMYRLLGTDAKLAWTLILWIVFAVVPAATARETPHALRIENSLPAWQIFIAFAIISNFKFQISNWKKKVMFFMLVILYLGSFSYFWHNYFNHYAREYSSEWQFGYKQAVSEMQRLEGSYERVVMSEAYGRSYMYTLFYARIDPSLYLVAKQSTFDAAGFYHVFGFGKYSFPDRGIGSFDQGTLYMSLPSEAPGGARVLATVDRPNGEHAFIIFDKP